MHMRFGAMVLCGFVFVPSFAIAQDESARNWTVAAGREDVAVRDVSRSGIPIDTSPTSLDGSGWFAAVEYELLSPTRSATLGASFMRSGSLAIVGPVLRIDTAGDATRRLEARYEYTRFFWRDRVVRGLTFGLGALALAASEHLDRDAPPVLTRTTSDLEGGGGGLAAVRLDLGSRVTLEGRWSMSLLIGRSTDAVEGPTPASSTQSGGGWLIESRAGGSVRLTDRFRLSAFYNGAGQARFGSHRGQADRRGRLEIGVTHVR